MKHLTKAPRGFLASKRCWRFSRSHQMLTHFASWAILISGFGFFGCASYQSKVDDARSALSRGESEKAVKLLEPLANEEGKDQLVYMLDYGTALQQAKHFKESEKTFERASVIADIQDYHSVSKIAEAALLSENMIQYKGDNFEKLMINAINSINFLETDNLDEALVEIKRLNEKLYKFKTEAGITYDQNPFAYFLGGIVWEAEKKWDDAYIDYKEAYGLDSELPGIREDLIRLAKKAQRTDDLEKWQKQFPEVKPKPEWNDNAYGEIVFVYEQGWGPRKHPRPGAPRFPALFPVRSVTQRARLRVDSGKDTTDAVKTQLTDEVFSIERVAIKTLNDDYGRLVASRVGGMIAKGIVAEQVRQKNELLGLATWVALNVADQADLRQWSTLPQTIQVARMRVLPGSYKVMALGLSGGDGFTGEEMPERQIEVRAGHKTFVTWRSVK